MLRHLSKNLLQGRYLSQAFGKRKITGESNPEPITNQYWRDASSVIITAKDVNPEIDGENDQIKNKVFDYRILVLEGGEGKSKKQSKGSFFPGGVACEADFSIEWANVFTYCQKRDLGEIIGELKNGRKKPPILSDHRHAGIPPELGFRIAAIRETFEKTGLLLVKGPRMPEVEDSVFEEFRNRVVKDPTKFAHYCKELSVVPDVWSLLDWGNWLTPVMPGEEMEEAPAVPKRLDTISYLCCLDWIPLVHCDGKGAKDARWVTPNNVSSNGNKLSPQVSFELARLYNFDKLSTLHTFASQRATLGIERYMSVYIKCKDGLLCVLPGDDLYPEKPDFQGLKPPKNLPHTIEELNNVSDRHHRQELREGEKMHTYNCNVNLRYGQPVPHKDFSKFLGRL